MENLSHIARESLTHVNQDSYKRVNSKNGHNSKILKTECSKPDWSSDSQVKAICDEYDGLFDMAAGEREGMEKKPAPDMVELVLNTLQVSKEEAVYIGDSEVDIATAHNSGLHLCAVAWGFRDSCVLKEHGAEHIFADTESLQKYLLQG